MAEQDRIEKIYRESEGDFSMAMEKLLETPVDSFGDIGENLKGKRLKELAQKGVELDFGQHDGADSE